MTDAQLIDLAYEAAIQDLFINLFRSYTTSKTQAERDQADQRFQSGVQLAREARNQAKKLV